MAPPLAAVSVFHWIKTKWNKVWRELCVCERPLKWWRQIKAAKEAVCGRKQQVTGAGRYPACREEPFVVGYEQRETTFLHLFFRTCFRKTPLVSMKNTIADEAGCPLALTNAHLRAAAGSREPFLSIFQKPRWGGGDSEWSISGKGWSAHQTSEMTTASQTDESAQSLWKERERDVHIHPSILVSGTARHPAVPPKPDAWHNHPTCTHTHSLVFTLERQIGDSHTFMHSNIHTHFHSHTHYHGRGELATSCWHFHRH